MEEGTENVLCTETVQETPQFSEEKTSPENSEYDSVDSYSDEEQRVSKSRSGAAGESHSETEGSVILEREEGDGQESIPAKKVDDDEDKKNPQYIPKRGTFYEHDDRCAETETAETTELEKGEKDKKKVWQEKKEKWSHDRFNDNEQAPKSRAELIAIYGYDIRNEEGPPKARRRRRYGRGPNKYTRKWEDEEAYSKPPTPRVKTTTRKQTRPKNNQTEEFPPLGSKQHRNQSRSSESNVEEEYTEIDSDNTGQRTASERQETSNNTEEPLITKQTQVIQDSRLNKQPQQQKSSFTRSTKPKTEVKDSDYRGFTSKTRQQRGVRSEQQKVLPSRNSKKDSGDFIHTQNFTNKKEAQIDELEKNINNLNVQDSSYKNNKHGNNQSRQGSVPPRLQQSEQKGPKRYSSMRQRSLPETATPPVPPYSHSFYPSDYNSAAPPPPSQQPILPPSALPPNIVAQQVPVTAAAPALLQAPFPGAPYTAQPPPGAFIQAAPPPAFISAPQQAQIVSYVTQAQPAFGATPGYQGFQQQFNPVSQPTELYQTGITYYSTDQQIPQRVVPQKRPKAAIPIVDPTEFRDKHNDIDGFTNQSVNIANINENSTQEINHSQEFPGVNE